MRITEIVAIPVSVPRAKPLEAAGTVAPLRSSEFGIVRIETDDGLTGWGEISMNGGMNGARQCPVVQDLIGPDLRGHDPFLIRQAVQRMDALLPGMEPAKSGVEMALWDLVGKALDRPLHELLGGKVREGLPVRWGIGFGDPVAGAEEAQAKVAAGFASIKLKIGRPGTPEDRVMVETVRRAVGDDVSIMVDANSAYRTRGEALHELRPLEQFALQLIEQPLPRPRLADLAVLRQQLSTPLLLDESMGPWRDAYRVAQAGAADVLSVYVCEAGGIQAALNALAVGDAAGLQGLLGSQCELGIGTAAMAHVGVVAPSIAYQSDATGHLRYDEDIIVGGLDYRDGKLHPPSGPGLGVTVDEDRLARYRIN